MAALKLHKRRTWPRRLPLGVRSTATANHRAMARALKLEGSPLMGLTYSDGDKFLDAAAQAAPETRRCPMIVGGSPT
jgi:hypothetical protein